MLAKIPIFKKISLSDKAAVDKFVKTHPPYSDFNFVSLWSYNVNKSCLISLFNGNLVLKYSDYVTGEPFYTFLGNKDPVGTIRLLLARSKKENINQELRMIPEVNVEGVKKRLNEFFIVEEDRDSFDYVVSAKALRDLRGFKYKTKRRCANSFCKLYPNHEVKVVNLKNRKVQEQIEELFLSWAKAKNHKEEEIRTELNATKRAMKLATSFNLITIAIFVKDKLIGYSINESVHGGYYMAHFGKVDESYSGVFQYLEKITAKYFFEQGCKYMNFQQDLGLPGLRRSKMSYRPEFFLKKYTISEKQ